MRRKINLASTEILMHYDEHPHSFAPLFWESPEKNKLFYPHSCFNQSKEELEESYDIKFPVNQRQLYDLDPGLANSLNTQTAQFVQHRTHTERNTVEYFLDKKEKMILPVIVDLPGFFKTDVDSFNIPSHILKHIHCGNITLLFSMHFEGHFHEYKYIAWLNDFAKKFKLDRTNFYFANSNLISDELYDTYEKYHCTENLFSIFTDSFFEHQPWFFPNTNHTKTKKEDRVFHYTKFHEFLRHNESESKKSVFLSLNRRLDIHRLLTIAQFKSNPLLHDHKISLGNVYNAPIQEQFISFIDNVLDLSYFDNPRKIRQAVDEVIKQIPIVLDEDTSKINFANNLNLDLQRNTFVSVVTESLYTERSVFFSEKIYKPIYCAQPFIIVGSPYSLKKLREQGYQTFGKWWDESYDEEPNFIKRLTKLEKVYEYIGSLSYSQLYDMTVEMEDVFINNFNTLMSLDRLSRSVNFLEDLCDGDFKEID